MKKWSIGLAPLFVLLLGACAATAPLADTLDFADHLSPIGADNRLAEPGWFVWGGSCIRGEDGRYYLFYARWREGSAGRAAGDEQRFKGMNGWLKYSEIAVAVADQPSGPFRHVATVLQGSGEAQRWDRFCAHNPHVQRFDGKVYLYYVANNPVEHKDPWLAYADGQRIGVVVADSVQDLVAGRGTRCAEPLMAPDGERTFCRAVNPSVAQAPDGSYLMMFKTRSAATQGHMTHWIARAARPSGPFTLAGPALLDEKLSAEDPYFWYDPTRRRFYAIVKDFSRSHTLTPQFGALALLTSGNGVDGWQPAQHNLVSMRRFVDDQGTVHELSHLERPQLLLDDDGTPLCLYAAAGEQDPWQGTPSFNLHFELRIR